VNLVNVDMKLLFICTHNCCRSILFEAICSFHGNHRLEARSAGSVPVSEVHPLTLKYLEVETTFGQFQPQRTGAHCQFSGHLGGGDSLQGVVGGYVVYDCRGKNTRRIVAVRLQC